MIGSTDVLRKQFKATLLYLRFWLSGMLLFQAGWMIDFSHTTAVYLPLVVTTITIPGKVWYAIALLYEVWSLVLISNVALSKYGVMCLFGITLQTVNYIITAQYYGLVWNDIFYFIILPFYVAEGLQTLRHAIFLPSSPGSLLGEGLR